MGVPNEAQSDTVKAVRALLDADRAGTTPPHSTSAGWSVARTVQVIAADDELVFEVIRTETGALEQVVDVLVDGGLRIRERCGEQAPGGFEGAPEWLKSGMTCVRWEHHDGPHRVGRRADGPFFEWQDLHAASDDEYTRQLDELMKAYAPVRDRWRSYVAAAAERRDAAPEHPAVTWAAGVRAKMERLSHEDDAMAQQPQRQDALSSQLRDVAVVATRMGCYDAADFISRRLVG